MNNTTLNVSTVTPVYCGEQYLENLVKEIEKIKVEWKQKSYPIQIIESIFVIDSAKDNSINVLKKLTKNKEYEWIKIIELSKNFGQHPATMCGVLYSTGDWIITLDEDLQHHPQEFIEMFKPIGKKSFDIIYAKPKELVHKSFLRDWGSRGFKKIIAKITKNPFVSDFNSFRLMRGSIARAAASVCGHETYFDMALCWFTDKISTIVLNLEDHRFVDTGASSYSFWKLLSHARRLFVSSQTKLLRFGAWIGIVCIFVSALLGLHFLYLKFNDPEAIPVRGWTSLYLTILFMGGLTATLLSIILEYLGSISLQNQGKPLFFTIDRSSDCLIQSFFNTKSTNKDHDHLKEL